MGGLEIHEGRVFLGIPAVAHQVVAIERCHFDRVIRIRSFEELLEWFPMLVIEPRLFGEREYP